MKQGKNRDGYNDLGLVQLRQGHVDDALASLAISVERHPDFAVAHFDYGNALFTANRLAEAEAQYRTALKLQLGGMDQAVVVTQTVDTATATLTPSSPLQAGQTYTVVANAQVVASNNGSPMASTYSGSAAHSTAE